MREPIANRTHYPNGPTLLDRAMEEIFESVKGPGAMPERRKERGTRRVKGIIVPHASIKLAGPCAAWGYKQLQEKGERCERYIIIAQGQKTLEAGTTFETFKMPYGEVRTDQDFVRELVKKGNIAVNDRLHMEENIIEVQLPFIQNMHRNELEKIKIVPIIVNNDTNFKELSVDIKETLMEQDKMANIIFVTNLAPFGRAFHFVPFTEEVTKNIAAIDKQLIDNIISFNEEGFFEAVHRTMVPLSGYTAMKMMFTLMNPKKITLEQNYLSGDINNDYKNMVSYASFVIM